MNRLTRVTIKNYKSLQDTTVELGALNVLVGANGSGKSNFLDALEFVRDVLQNGLDSALEKREYYIRSFANWRDENVHIQLKLLLGGKEYEYGFGIHARDFFVVYESCKTNEKYFFERNRDGVTERSTIQQLPLNNKGLWLPLLMVPELVPVHQFLTEMHFYNPIPLILREKPKHYAPSIMGKFGQNFVLALRHFLKNSKSAENFKNTVQVAIPFLEEINTEDELNNEVPEVRVVSRNADYFVQDESDGTLRILAIFLALYQNPADTFLAIEEPELNVHPRALAALCDVIKETAVRSQIIITTHSPDMISRFQANDLRIVERTNTGTKIGLLLPEQIDVLEAELFMSSDLLRIEGLQRATEE